MASNQEEIPLSKLFLDLQNPRFEPVKDEAAAIAHLAKDEKVSALAEDIVRQGGLNPLEIIGVILATGIKASSKKYTVVEGNRRICALKLLGDPDLAPPEFRKRFTKLAEKWKEAKSLNALVFKSREEAKPWLERLHEGEKDGVGRRAWDAPQKQRFTGTAKNAPAMLLLDYAVEEGWVSKEETDGLLTTIQRFINNPVLRNQLGIAGTDREVLRRDRPQEDFNKLAERFIKDAATSKNAPMKMRKVHSRANGEDIVTYANNLIQNVSTSGERIEPEVVNGDGSSSQKKKQSRKTRPRPPEVPQTLHHDQALYDSLKKIKNRKLIEIYYSICSIELESHPVLISVGVWSFFECLSAMAGRNDGIPFTGFLSKSFIQNECGQTKDAAKAVVTAVEAISRRGNESKHHLYAGSYDPKEINNNWVVTQCVVAGMIKMIPPTK